MRGSCWIWDRGVNNGGYGTLSVDGRKGVMAHRYYYERVKDKIPAGFVLDHLCRNRRCVNPEHLEPVPHVENCRRGSTAILTPDQVREIRDAPRYYGSRRDLADQYGVGVDTITEIRRGRRWAAA